MIRCGRWDRASELLDVRVSDEAFERPTGFDLVAFWAAWCRERETSFSQYVTTVRVAPSLFPFLPRYFGDGIRSRMAQAGSSDAEGWVRLELSFESLETARDRILALGRGVEVLEPQALRRSVLDYAEQIVSLYSD